MAKIVLDTNILRPDLDLGSAAFEMLHTLAGALNHELLLPSIVAVEAVETFRKNANETAQKYVGSAQAMARYDQTVRLPEIRVDELAASRDVDLRGLFKVVAAPPGAAEQALEREARRIPPAREKSGQGIGARDCVIWLTVKSLVDAGDDVYFVTDDADFGHPDLRTELRAELRDDGRLTYCTSLAGLLQTLATKDDTAIVDRLLDSTETREAIVAAAAQAVFVAVTSAIGNVPQGFVQGAGAPVFELATAAPVIESYGVGGEHFAVVVADWAVIEDAEVRYLQAADLLSGNRFRARLRLSLTLLIEHDGSGNALRASVVAMGRPQVTSIEPVEYVAGAQGHITLSGMFRPTAQGAQGHIELRGGAG